ncbi:PIN domain-containing protein [Methylobacterium komagatae]
MTFVDASALVAILTGEPQRSALLKRIDAARIPLTSGLAIFETVTAVARKKTMTVAEAQAEVDEFVRISGMWTVPIGEERNGSGPCGPCPFRQGAPSGTPEPRRLFRLCLRQGAWGAVAVRRRRFPADRHRPRALSHLTPRGTRRCAGPRWRRTRRLP